MKRTAVTFTLIAVFAASFAAAAVRSLAVAATGPRTHVVRMILQEGRYEFEPAEVRAHTGDRIRFVMVSGAPHNVAFDPDGIAPAAQAALSGALPERMSALAGPLLTQEGATYTMNLDGVPPGRYPFFCMPHVALKMTGLLIVEP
ncbi:hypothetical protein BH23GEM9_BH23GEM9_13160 [soil metagenome]